MTERATEIDYAVVDSIEVAHREGLIEALRAHHGQPVRLLGSGSSQLQLPPPDSPVTLIRTAKMARIQRLDAADLTCSVEPGVTREHLDREFAAAGVCLPCRGTGTIGGILAADLHAPGTPGATGARGVLLGLEGVLADGLSFKSGARVVKNVAGFDLQKLFVGSRGRLFAATLLHLKLRHLPARTQWFHRRDCTAESAWSLWRTLRTAAEPARDLYLLRQHDHYSVCGEFAGAATEINERLAQHDLTPVDGDPAPRQSESHDVVAGFVRPSVAAALIAVIPGEATLSVNGVGQFEAALPAAAADSLLAHCAAAGIVAELRVADVSRRGQATPLDPQVNLITEGLHRALDPAEMLR